jgi:hypothetical protein
MNTNICLLSMYFDAFAKKGKPLFGTVLLDIEAK